MVSDPRWWASRDKADKGHAINIWAGSVPPVYDASYGIWRSKNGECRMQFYAIANHGVTGDLPVPGECIEIKSLVIQRKDRVDATVERT